MSNTQVPPPGMFVTLYNRYIVWLDEQGKSGRTRWAVIALLVTAVLVTFASLSFLNLWEWIYVLVGAPAGVLLFLVLIGVAYFTPVAEWRLVAYKETYPPARRIRDAVIGIVGFLVLLLVLGTYVVIPRGVGGAAIVLIALLAYNVTRRTPQEIQYSVAGIPDPREIREEEEDE